MASNDSIFVTAFKVDLADGRHGTVYVQTKDTGPQWHFAKDICFPANISASDLDDLVKSILIKNGYIINPNMKCKKADDPVVNYSKATETPAIKPLAFLINEKNAKDKVILVPHKREYNEIVVYAIKEKSSGRFISALDGNTYRTSKNEPLFFTADDVALIGNSEQFEIIKMTRKCKNIINKIAK